MASNLLTKKKLFETSHVVKIRSKSAKIGFLEFSHWGEAVNAVIRV